MTTISEMFLKIQERDQRIATLEANQAALLEALERMSFLARKPDEDAIECFERIADRFYRETGIMRPGKSDALHNHTQEERSQAFDAWVEEIYRKARAVVQQVKGGEG